MTLNGFIIVILFYVSANEKGLSTLDSYIVWTVVESRRLIIPVQEKNTESSGAPKVCDLKKFLILDLQSII